MFHAQHNLWATCSTRSSCACLMHHGTSLHPVQLSQPKSLAASPLSCLDCARSFPGPQQLAMTSALRCCHQSL